MREDLTGTIDSMFDGFKISDEGPIERKPITLWVPVEYYEKYEAIQKKSRCKFGKLLKEVVKRSIDKVNVED